MATTFTAAGPYVPTRAVAGGNYTEFGACDQFSQNYVIDKTVVDLPFSPLAFTVVSTNVGLRTMASGARTVSEVNTTGIGGVLITTTNDQLCFRFRVPVDMDPSKEFAVRYEFANCAGIKYSAATDLITSTTYWLPLKSHATTAALPTTKMSWTSTNARTTIGSAIYGFYDGSWQAVNDSAVLAQSLVPGLHRVIVRTDFTLATNVTSVFVTGVQLGYYKKLQG